MIKGWKNDPKWIEHYNKKDEERRIRKTNRIRAEIAQAEIGAALDEQLRKFHPMYHVQNHNT